MTAKTNKDGFIPGELVDYKRHNQYMIQKRLKEKNQKAKKKNQKAKK